LLIEALSEKQEAELIVKEILSPHPNLSMRRGVKGMIIPRLLLGEGLGVSVDYSKWRFCTEPIVSPDS